MTEQEERIQKQIEDAIEVLGFLKKDFENKAKPRCKFARVRAGIFFGIKALEKQVSQKPIDKSKNPADWHVMACPCCEYVFWNSGQFFHYEPKHCDKCGQKIDWGE